MERSHSDNGSNFKGAHNDLNDLYKFLESQAATLNTLTSYLLSQRITWQFSPERAPHFGGLWEAAVKSAKQHLRRVIGQQRLDFEEFCTILCHESCMNSRPLLPISSHADAGIETLTQGHFLIGRPLLSFPETDRTTVTSPLHRWMLCQNIVQHFWQHWSSEYLQQLQRLPKWKQPNHNLQVGDVVLIQEHSPLHPMAKIVSIFPGRDGKVWVVQLKTANSLLNRPTSWLVLLLPQ